MYLAGIFLVLHLNTVGVFVMFCNLLKDHILDWCAEEDSINWEATTHLFLRSTIPSLSEITTQEARLKEVGYTFPPELKAFWQEIGCGYLCSNEMLDNGLEEPHTILDIYFQEGDWQHVHFTCDILANNELPFFRVNSLNYLTIGLEPGVNLGKIYCCGEEIAPSLTAFVEHLLQDTNYYTNLKLIQSV